MVEINICPGYTDQTAQPSLISLQFHYSANLYHLEQKLTKAYYVFSVEAWMIVGNIPVMIDKDVLHVHYSSDLH